jgi:transposase InsO family protein
LRPQNFLTGGFGVSLGYHGKQNRAVAIGASATAPLLARVVCWQGTAACFSARHKQVWCADITYIPMARGFFYLVLIMDRVSRAVLAWRLSNTRGADFCVEALEDALEQYGKPEIFYTDQGCQFTSTEFTGVLERGGITISMDGKGRSMDNIFVERLWRSLKYEEVYLNAYACVAEAKAGIGAWLVRFLTMRSASTRASATAPRAKFTRKTYGYVDHQLCRDSVRKVLQIRLIANS